MQDQNTVLALSETVICLLAILYNIFHDDGSCLVWGPVSLVHGSTLDCQLVGPGFYPRSQPGYTGDYTGQLFHSVDHSVLFGAI